jgi:hypothetical protein
LQASSEDKDPAAVFEKDNNYPERLLPLTAAWTTRLEKNNLVFWNHNHPPFVLR